MPAGILPALAAEQRHQAVHSSLHRLGIAHRLGDAAAAPCGSLDHGLFQLGQAPAAPGGAAHHRHPQLLREPLQIHAAHHRHPQPLGEPLQIHADALALRLV